MQLLNPPTPRIRWTEAERELLVTEWAAGTEVDVIAAALGRSVGGIQDMRRLLQLPSRYCPKNRQIMPATKAYVHPDRAVAGPEVLKVDHPIALEALAAAWAIDLDAWARS